MYFVKTPYLISKVFYRNLIWELPDRANQVYLTFDDGPNPDLTPEVIKILDDYKIKATFFCVGENVKSFPDTYKLILSNGHLTGNHTYNHLNGWKTDTNEFINNVNLASKHINSKLFRPPYGRIKRSQLRKLQKEFEIIMWSVLSGDFDKNVSKDKCYQNVIKNTKPGSIIVFHDSHKAMDKVYYALPKTIDYLLEKNYSFGLIPHNKN